jgi:hypothetical protein
MLLLALLLAAPFDGEAALRHASALAALGPHPWGSPRARAAAEYVAAEFRQAGLGEVRLQEFESHGIRGANVIGVLRAAGPEFVLVGAHHDSAPRAPGAYDDGGGVGVLIETARVLAVAPSRSRTIVFVSFDGEEAWSTGLATTAGSRAYLESLGPERGSLVAAFVVEMCGWKRGSPLLHPIAYADPLRPGAYVLTPAWLMSAAEAGSREAGAPMGVGDPWVSALYQAAVRTFRVDLYGDDLSFLQAGRPALFASDSSFVAFYPWYHAAADTADKLDADALARMGRGVVGVVRALERTPGAPAAEPVWFSAFGRVVGRGGLLAAGTLLLLPGLLAAFSRGGLALGARLLQAALLVLLLWSHPVPALWVFALPCVLTIGGRSWWRTGLALLPLAGLLAVGGLAWRRGIAHGLWLAPWELGVAGLALALLWLGPGRPIPRKTGGRLGAGAPGRRASGRLR